MFADEEDEGEEQAWDQLFLSHAELGRDYRRAVKDNASSRARWTGRLDLKGEAPDTFGKAVDGHHIRLFGRHQLKLPCYGLTRRANNSLL